MRAFRLCVEGGDWVGKSSLVSALERKFEQGNLRAKVIKAPGGTEIGTELRSLALGLNKQIEMHPLTLELLFQADFCELWRKLVPEVEEDHDVLIFDRGFLTGLVYGVADRRADLATLVKLYALGTGYLTHSDPVYTEMYPKCSLFPYDAGIILTGDPVKLKERAQRNGRPVGDRFENKPMEFHEELRRNFTDFANLVFSTGQYSVYDTLEHDKDAMYEDIWARLVPVVSRHIQSQRKEMH